MSYRVIFFPTTNGPAWTKFNFCLILCFFFFLTGPDWWCRTTGIHCVLLYCNCGINAHNQCLFMIPCLWCSSTGSAGNDMLMEYAETSTICYTTRICFPFATQMHNQLFLLVCLQLDCFTWNKNGDCCLDCTANYIVHCKHPVGPY